MQRCPHCDADVHEVASTCRACGKSLGDEKSLGQDVSSIGELSGNTPTPSPVAPSTRPSAAPTRSRLVSRVGPAVPLVARNDDSVPAGGSSWLSRLESLKQTASTSAQATNPPGTLKIAVPGPPPLKRKPNTSTPDTSANAAKGASMDDVASYSFPAPRPGVDEVVPKPAEMLLLELEARERERAKERQKSNPGLGSALEEISKSELARHEIKKPEAKITKRKVPVWVWAIGISACVGGAVFVATYQADQEPPPAAPQVDPELVKKAANLKAAHAAIEDGHALFGASGDDKDKIDRAIAKYQRAIELEPTMARAERALGVAYAKKGDEDLAAAHYRRFLELDPSNAEAPQIRALLRRYEEKKPNK